MDKNTLELAVRAANIDEIQNLMADYVTNCLKMDYQSSMENLFAIDNPEVSFELMESGEYKGPEKVRAYMTALHERAQSFEEKKGWMEFQHLTTPKIVISENGTGDRAAEFIKVNGEWKILKLHLIAYVRTPFEEGWMRQADCMRIAPVRTLKPDQPPRYYTFHPDAVYSFDNIYNWGPYLPEEL